MARALAGRLAAPRFVFANAERCIVAAGIAEERQGPDFDVVDAAADGRLWFVRAPFDVQRAWPGRAGVSVWRPRSAFVIDERGVSHVDADGRSTDVSGDLPQLPAALPISVSSPLSSSSGEGGGGVRSDVDDASDVDAYEAAVGVALAHIAAGEGSKLVVARRARLSLPARPAFDALIGALIEDFAERSTVYGIENDDDDLFFGASPEQLLRRTGDAIDVDAVAGTRPVAEGAALLESEKDKREHRHVVEGIVAALAPLVTSTTVSPLRVVERGGLAHLACSVGARGSGTLSALLAALHPTPATAGTPTSTATRLLRSIEGFDRGDYGGVVGVVDGSRAVFAVCLRAARICQGEAWVYAGAGVVDGSDPASEWRETSHKARVLLPAIARALRC
ncbi:MAG: chorismate-binding protein [Deltaproteobacteria bacterium]|nr:chorismate-binding protein [Deltaproteobacteria bacterium]